MMQMILDALTPVELIGYLGTTATIVTYAMSKMIPLRIAGMTSSVSFIIYGLFTHSFPVVLMEGILLPLNGFRLWQMVKLVRQVKEASEGSLSMAWLEPFSNRQSFEAGQVLFNRSETATEMFYILSGQFRLVEADISISAGQVVGEMGLVSEGNERTQTLVCVTKGEALSLDYNSVRQIYAQNPEFGFYFLRLISARMLENLTNAEERAGVPLHLRTSSPSPAGGPLANA